MDSIKQNNWYFKFIEGVVGEYKDNTPHGDITDYPWITNMGYVTVQTQLQWGEQW